MENKYRSLDELPLALRVEDLMPILGIGRNTAYELVRSGQIRSIKIGRQIRVPRVRERSGAGHLSDAEQNDRWRMARHLDGRILKQRQASDGRGVQGKLQAPHQAPR